MLQTTDATVLPRTFGLSPYAVSWVIGCTSYQKQGGRVAHPLFYQSFFTLPMIAYALAKVDQT